METLIEKIAMSRLLGWLRHGVSMLIGILLAHAWLAADQSGQANDLLVQAGTALLSFGWLVVQHWLAGKRPQGNGLDGLNGRNGPGGNPSGLGPASLQAKAVLLFLIPALMLQGCAVFEYPGFGGATKATLEIVGVRTAEALAEAVFSQALSAADAGQKVDIAQGLATGLRTLEGTAVTSDMVAQLVVIWTPQAMHWKALAGQLKEIYTDARPTTLAAAWAVLEKMAVVLETPPAKAVLTGGTTVVCGPWWIRRREEIVSAARLCLDGGQDARAPVTGGSAGGTPAFAGTGDWWDFTTAEG